jgi:hypothetical protein
VFQFNEGLTGRHQAWSRRPTERDTCPCARVTNSEIFQTSGPWSINVLQAKPPPSKAFFRVTTNTQLGGIFDVAVT